MNLKSQLQRWQLWLIPFQLIIIIGTVGLITGVTLAMVIILVRGGITPALTPKEAGQVATAQAVARRQNSISRVFTPEVQYWSPYIMRWSREYDIDPDILATVIQIESCGQYLVNSPAGAKGLFQVMPFHFPEGEDPLDVDTNAKRGIIYLREGLEIADGHIGLAMAGYNGGHGVINWGWARWAQETRNYYIWGSGIYMDALLNKQPEESAALQSWLNAGGSRLCRQAANVIATRSPGWLTPTSSSLITPTQPYIQPVQATQPVTIPTYQPVDGPPTATPTPTLYIPPLTPTVIIPPVRTVAPTVVIPPTITPSGR